MSAAVLTRDPDAFAVKAPHLAKRQDVGLIRGDIQTFEFPEGSFEYIVHAATAASAKLNQENPMLMYDTITLGTRRVLQFAEKCEVQKLLLTSSGAVYGRQPAGVSHIPESYFGGPDLTSPSSAYAEGKRAAEHICVLHAQAHNYSCKLARCFAFVGPHLPLDAHFAIGNFLGNVHRGEAISILGDGTAVRSYMYTADLAVWLWVILFAGKAGTAYNVGSEEGLTIKEIAACVKNATRPDTSVHIRQQLVSNNLVERYVPSTGRAKETLGVRSPIKLLDAISKTYSWLK
jgi:nucleoside-diphosphate-sugar epimerase